MTELYVITVGLLCLVVLLYLWLKSHRYGRSNPLLYLCYPVFVYLFIQSLTLIYSDKNVSVDGMPFIYIENVFLYAHAVMINCYVFFGLFFFISLRFFQVDERKNEVNYFLKNEFLVVLLITLVVFYSVYDITAGSILNEFSSSKYLNTDISGSATFDPKGYMRFLSKLGMITFLLFLAFVFLFEGKRTKKNYLIIGVLSIPAFLPHFILSSRGFLLFGFISILLMLIEKGALKLKHFLLPSLFGGGAFYLMTLLRFKEANDAESFSFIESISLYGGGNSVFNFSVIYDYITQGGKLFWGEIYLGIITLPIPRSLWSDKPLFSFDQIIASDLYGYYDGVNAIPAGLFGELFLNFGFIGLFIGVPLFGLFSAYIYIRCRNAKDYLFSFFLVTVVFPRYILMLFGSGLGFALMEAVLILLPAFLIKRFVVKEVKYG